MRSLARSACVLGVAAVTIVAAGSATTEAAEADVGLAPAQRAPVAGWGPITPLSERPRAAAQPDLAYHAGLGTVAVWAQGRRIHFRRQTPQGEWKPIRTVPSGRRVID